MHPHPPAASPSSPNRRPRHRRRPPSPTLLRTNASEAVAMAVRGARRRHRRRDQRADHGVAVQDLGDPPPPAVPLPARRHRPDRRGEGDHRERLVPVQPAGGLADRVRPPRLPHRLRQPALPRVEGDDVVLARRRAGDQRLLPAVVRAGRAQHVLRGALPRRVAPLLVRRRDALHLPAVPLPAWHVAPLARGVLPGAGGVPVHDHGVAQRTTVLPRGRRKGPLRVEAVEHALVRRRVLRDRVDRRVLRGVLHHLDAVGRCAAGGDGTELAVVGVRHRARPRSSASAW